MIQEKFRRYELWIGNSFQSVAWNKKQLKDKEKMYGKRWPHVDVRKIKF